MPRVNYGFLYGSGRGGIPIVGSAMSDKGPAGGETKKEKDALTNRSVHVKAHSASDIDFSPQSQHHTIGTGPMQAASGADLAKLQSLVGKFEFDTTDLTGITGTSYVTGTPVVGFSFIAPESGWVLVHTQGRLESNNNTIIGLLSWQIREGSTVASGTVVYNSTQADADEASLVSGPNVTAGGASLVTPSGMWPRSLDPGETFNISLIHRATGSSIDIFNRQVMVFPLIDMDQ